MLSSVMSRMLLVIAFACVVALAAQGELVKPLDLNKRSSFEDKEFATKSKTTKEFSTKQFEPPGEYKSKTYSTKDFSYSSKNFETRASRYSGKEFSVRDLPVEHPADADKRFATKSFESDKEVHTPPTPHQIADKPVTDWRTLIRKEPPRGMPGKHQDLPFSRWKIEAEAK